VSNLDKVRDFIAKWEARDVDAIVEAFSDDPFYHNMPMEPLTSKAAIRAFIAPFLEPVSRVEWTVHFIAEDVHGVVLTERTDACEFGAQRIALPVMGTFEFVDGKLSKWRDYFDLREFENQMAALQN
jgi:limonene-1,2-epoxide hydrolase